MNHDAWFSFDKTVYSAYLQIYWLYGNYLEYQFQEATASYTEQELRIIPPIVSHPQDMGIVNWLRIISCRSSLVLKEASQVSGTWTVDMFGKASTFAIVKGKLVIDGESKKLKPSENKDHPSSEGWFMYAPGSYIQIKSNSDIKVVTKVGFLEVPVAVTKPKPVAAEGKYLCV